MRKKLAIFFTAVLAGCASHIQQSPQTFESAVDIISFDHGYKYHNRLEVYGLPYNLDLFIAGLKSASNHDALPFSEETVDTAWNLLKTTFSENQKADNLIASEKFLEAIASDPEVIEVGSHKLYYKILQQGNGTVVEPSDMIQATYCVMTLQSGQETEVFACEKATISIPDTIPGFAQGMANVQIGEHRKLYIHPDLAYGSYGGHLEPNQLVIIEIEVHKVVQAL